VTFYFLVLFSPSPSSVVAGFPVSLFRWPRVLDAVALCVFYDLSFSFLFSVNWGAKVTRTQGCVPEAELTFYWLR
jgi:hypothetical protein